MRDFHSSSVAEQLYRLAEIAKQPYKRSSRERRACVAVIFRLALPNTPVQQSPTASSTSSTSSSSAHSPAPLSRPTSPASSTASDPAPSPPPADPASPPSPAFPSSPPLRAPFPPTGYSRYLSPTPSYSRLISHVHSLTQQPFARSSHLELLFIQRALNPSDRWSGQMALPGGRQQRGESDYITAVREVHEEVGLSLWDDDCWLYVGRMDDRHIDSFGGVKPLAVCPFIFLQRSAVTPRIVLDAAEVHAALFTPLSFFTDPAIRWDHLVHPLVRTWTSRWKGKRRVEVGYKVKKNTTSTAASPSPPSSSSSSSSPSASLRRLLPSLGSLPAVHFPALALPGHFETADGRHGISLRDTLIYQHTAEEQRQRQHTQQLMQSASTTAAQAAATLHADDKSDDDEDEDDDDREDSIAHGELTMDVDIEPGAFILWGFTLVLLSDLLLSSFNCASLSSQIDRGQKERQRMLRVLYRSIDLMDAVERRWKEVRDSSGRLLHSITGDRGRAADDGEGGVDVKVHRDVAAAASTDEEMQRRQEENERRQRAANQPPVSKL